MQLDTEQRSAVLEGFRLSPQQARLWAFLGDPPAQGFLARCRIRIEGDLDLSRLKRALEQVVARHEILRTAFRQIQGMRLPLQVLTLFTAVDLRFRDLEADGPGKKGDLEDEADLEQPPLLHATLSRVSPSLHRLDLAMPALCMDRIGLANLAREIGSAYAADGGVENADEPVQYVDATEILHDLLESEDTARGREHWQRVSLAPLRGLQLPGEVKGSGRFSPAVLSWTVDAETAERIDELVRRSGLSTASFLLAAWQVLLARLTGRRELIVGVACSGRSYEELKGALGLFAKHLPLAAEVGEEACFGEHWRRTAETLKDIAARQDFFAWPENEAGSDSFPFCFEAEEPAPVFEGPGIFLSVAEREVCFEPFTAKLCCLPREGRLLAELRYDADRLTTPQATLLLDRLAVLVRSAAGFPEQALRDLEILAPAERERLLTRFQPPRVPFPETCLHDLFVAQAERTPERTAVVEAEGTISYGELAASSFRLARHLQRLGVGPEARVAVHAERSAGMVTGLLGVLAAGGAYVPLDPSYPPERLAWILEDCAASVLLTGLEPPSAVLPGSIRVVRLDEDLSGEEARSPESGATPASLAYVIYTSGSTGRPKGVMVPHEAIVNRLLWMQRCLPLDGSDAVLQKTAFTFDASIWEIFLPLFVGARVVLAHPQGHRDPSHLVDLILRHGVTTLQMVPSMLGPFLEEPRAEGCSSLRRVFCGGEALPSELRKRFFSRFGAELHNLYGPTECAIDVSHWSCERDRREAERTADGIVPIGTPIDNTSIYLLDRALRPVPEGTAGELCAGGPGVARGYLGRPDLTAERFVPNPFGGSGSRLYRTGDLACHLPGGVLGFLGRTDQQVKVRGFRIEPAEIEASLSSHPDVAEAAVVAREPGLVAYVVLRQPCEPGALRTFLAERLPDYMVPAVFVPLPELPRLPSGKLSRQALPDPGPQRLDPAGFVASRTPTEEILAGIWSSVLGLDRVGVSDGFFDIGGHSLAATRVASRIHEAFQIDLRVRKVLEASTIAALAAMVDSERSSSRGISAPPLVPVPRDRDLPLSFAQQRLWFLQQLEPESSAYSLPGALRLSGPLDSEALRRAVSEIVRRHESLRTSFPEAEGNPVQIIHPAGPVAIPEIDLSALPEAEREAERLLESQSRLPFDLSRAPLLRLLLIGLGRDEQVLFFNLHHIISDGWSVGVLVRELSEFYAAFSSGLPPLLPKLPLQYADFAQWQRSWLQGEVLEAQLANWRERLRGAPEVLDLPVDRPHPLAQTYRGATRTILLPSDLSGQLRRFSAKSSASLYMVIGAAFKALLARYGAGDDIVVGTNIANRNRREIEDLIGFFVNALVLRTRLGGNPTFRVLLERFRETVLDAFTHQDLPFERLVEELQPRRDLSTTPLYQVVFDMNQADMAPSLRLPGLRVRPFALAETTAKFDLSLTAVERENGLILSVEHSTEILDASTVVRLLAHLQNLLQGIVADPEERLGDLPLLGDAEVSQLLAESRGPVREYPLAPIHRLFERQVEKRPGEVAAVCGVDRLTYTELNRQANRLAGLLRGIGVRPGDFVGILDERNLDFLVAMIAIFKAGAAYVPFDPSYPEDRLRYMITNSEAPTLLTRWELANRLGEVLAACPGLRSLVCFEAPNGAVLPGRDLERPELLGPAGWRSLPDRNPGEPMEELALPAYMLYTSGSTGAPKGAIIRQDGAVNHIYAQFEALDLGPELCFLQSAPSSSDISVWQFLAPLVAGGRTILVDLEIVSDPGRLFEVIRREGVTIIELVPTVLKGLIDHVRKLPAGERALPHLRWMMATGEAVPVDLVNEWLALYPEIPAVNAYGPTEASDDVVQAVLPEPLKDTLRALPIGRPLANFSCHIVDRWMNLAPRAIPGELCIAGLGVGLGYWRNPERTSLAFVPDPFAEAPGSVLYRTGDLARWLSDGQLEFLGRIDQQVKVRGYRIELGEIEAVLREHPAVGESVVIVRDDPRVDRRLVAYLVPAEPGRVVDPGELRDHLKKRLPGHMQPSVFLELAALPKTPNGKIDRLALPVPEIRSVAEGRLIAPRTPEEQTLAKIWSEVLRLEEARVGVESDFFELGGHSLLATQILSRVRAAFGIEMPLRKLFEHTTLERLAVFLSQSRQAAPVARSAPIDRVQRQSRRVDQTSEGIVKKVL